MASNLLENQLFQRSHIIGLLFAHYPLARCAGAFETSTSFPLYKAQLTQAQSGSGLTPKSTSDFPMMHLHGILKFDLDIGPNSNRTLVVTSATLVVTGALLVVTRSY